MAKKDKRRKEGIDRILLGTPSPSSPDGSLPKGGGKKKGKDKSAEAVGAPRKPKKAKTGRKGWPAPVQSIRIVLIAPDEAARSSFDLSTGCLELGIPLDFKLAGGKDTRRPQDGPEPRGGAGPGLAPRWMLPSFRGGRP